MNPSTMVYQLREAPETSHEANKYSQEPQTTTTSPPHPNEPPPSYDDATNSTSAPLLVGPPPNYGTQQAYTDADESSMSSHTEESTRVLPEWPHVRREKRRNLPEHRAKRMTRHGNQDVASAG